MSLYYPLTPVHRLCPSCCGYGRVNFELCRQPGCDGIGRIFVEGAPSFGCKTTLAEVDPGCIATLGNGDRGRIIRHVQRGEHDTPTTEVALIDDFLETEDDTTTTYPSSTGVRSVSPTSRLRKPDGSGRGRQDHLDPLQRRTLAL